MLDKAAAKNAANDDIGDREASARLQYAERLSKYLVFVGREVDHAIRDDDIDSII